MAASVHGPVTCSLSGAGEPLESLLDGVEVLAQQRDRATVVDAGGVGDAPARGLQVDPEPVEQGQRAADHAGGGTAPGHLGHVGETGGVGQVGQHHLDGVVVGALVVAGVRADAAGARHGDVTAAWTPTRAVAVIVQEPTTRVPW